MSKKMVSYDFSVDSLVAVEAPYGTNPETLMGAALEKLHQRICDNDITLVCDNTFDPQTGSDSELPEEWYENTES